MSDDTPPVGGASRGDQDPIAAGGPSHKASSPDEGSSPVGGASRGDQDPIAAGGPSHKGSSPEDEHKKLNPAQVVGSVFAAGLGVQSSKNRERDFKQGRLGVFIAAGIIFTLLFIGVVVTVVQVVLKNSGN